MNYATYKAKLGGIFSSKAPLNPRHKSLSSLLAFIDDAKQLMNALKTNKNELDESIAVKCHNKAIALGLIKHR